MASVITIRIPDSLRSDMESFGSSLNWSEEVRGLLERRVRQLANRRARDLFEAAARGRTPTPTGTSARSIREDRDAG